MIAILIAVRGNLPVVFICISFMAKEVGHFTLLAILPLPLKIPYSIHVPIFFFHWVVNSLGIAFLSSL
jgi:hypothetical protein